MCSRRCGNPAFVRMEVTQNSKRGIGIKRIPPLCRRCADKTGFAEIGRTGTRGVKATLV